MRDVLVTGATGSLGPPLLSALLESGGCARIAVLVRSGKVSAAEKFAQLIAAIDRPADTSRPTLQQASRVFPVVGDVCREGLGLSPAADSELRRKLGLVIHAAADTRFRSPQVEQRAVNVEGTGHVLRWAEHCPSLQRFVHVSTNCVAGQRMGEIAETIEPEPPPFVNFYEQTKWEAEQLVARAKVPGVIVRVATCAGSQSARPAHRLSGLHHGLRWMIQGLVPMIPGHAEAQVDLISSELAAGLIVRAATAIVPRHPLVCHASAGPAAPRLSELIEFLIAEFRQRDDRWRRGQLAVPVIVGAKTFAAFRHTVAASGDLLFQQVIDSVSAFLPALLYPKVYQTDNARCLWGGPLPADDWRRLIQRVLDNLIQQQSAITREQLADRLVQFINEVLPEIHTRLAQPPQVDRQTLLFENGLIDSLAIVHLIAFVEKTTGGKIPPRQVVMKHFRNIDAICDAFGPSPREALVCNGRGG